MSETLAARAESVPRHAAPLPADESSLVLVAHRGPVRFAAEDGHRIEHRNAGGLVTALEGIVQEVEHHVRWICAPASEEDRVVARTDPWTRFTTDSATCRVRMLDVERDAHDAFYNVIANPLLWFVQHDLYADAPPPIGAEVRHAWH
jgi:trehalose 6-phosphate synthase